MSQEQHRVSFATRTSQRVCFWRYVNMSGCTPPPSIVNNILDVICDYIATPKLHKYKMIVCSDCNLPCIDWLRLRDSFLEMALSVNLTHAVRPQTHDKAILDLVMSNCYKMVLHVMRSVGSQSRFSCFYYSLSAKQTSNNTITNFRADDKRNNRCLSFLH